MVTVIIPTYNREKTIQRSVESVLHQTYRDIEVLVIDDCSTDNTKKIIDTLREKDERLRYYKLEKNSGACVARNAGLDIAQGGIIAFQDSDDEWFPDKLEAQLKAMQKNNAEISFCQFNRIVPGKASATVPDLAEGFLERSDLLEESIVSTQTLVGFKECFDGIRFDPQMPRMQDYDITIRLSEKYKFYFVRRPLVNMYVQNDSISTNWEKLYIALERIFEKYPDAFQQFEGMRYQQTKYMALAKQKTGRSGLNDRWMCFAMSHRWADFKQVVKAVLINMKLVKI